MTAPPPDDRPVALVLGAAVWAQGPSPALVRRAMRAAELWRQGSVRHIVTCGGTGLHPPSEAEAARSLLIAAGVPPDAVSTEARSVNTRQNIGLALPVLRALGATRVVVVTDRWHAPRARLIARRLGLDAASAHPPLTRQRVARQVRSALRELPALVWHWIAFRPRR
jgi:uncharacterized SAM-binding protein YcdF (DUF218 family)